MLFEILQYQGRGGLLLVFTAVTGAGTSRSHTVHNGVTSLLLIVAGGKSLTFWTLRSRGMPTGAPIQAISAEGH